MMIENILWRLHLLIIKVYGFQIINSIVEIQELWIWQATCYTLSCRVIFIILLKDLNSIIVIISRVLIIQLTIKLC